MRKKIKITETLILYFVIIGFISIASVSLLTYYPYRRAILARSFEQLTAIRNLKRQKIEGFFNDRLRDVTLLSHSEDVRKIFTGFQNQAVSGLSEESYLYQYIFAPGYYNALVCSDMSTTMVQFPDTVLVSPGPWGGRNQDTDITMLSNKSKDAFLLDFSETDYDSLAVTIGSWVSVKNEPFAGIVALEIPLNAIDRIMVGSIGDHGFGESGESYLVGGDYLMRSSSRFIPRSVLQVRVETEAAVNAFLQGEGTIVILDYRGIPVLSSYCRLSVRDTGWALLSEIDLGEVMKPVYALRNRLLLVSISLIIIVFLIGWYLSLKIASPIIRIKEAALKVSSGDFPLIETVSGNEEINELLDTFNYMSAQLKEKKAQLQAEQLKQLSAMFDGQEKERKRLSYELHDGLGQSLVALKYRIESLMKQGGSPFPEALRDLGQSVTDAIEEVRQMSFSLMPAILSEFGLVPALQQMCGKLAGQTGTTIEFEADGAFEALDEQQKHYLFRIAQEILNNAIKHAEASLISLQLIAFPEFYTMIAEDNGKGFGYDLGVPFRGNGLSSIRERTEILKGKFILQSAIGKGTTIRIKIPR